MTKLWKRAATPFANMVEAPGIEPGSENALLLHLRAYPTF